MNLVCIISNCVFYYMYFLVHYLTRDLQKRPGMLKQGVTNEQSMNKIHVTNGKSLRETLILSAVVCRESFTFKT